LEDIVVIGAGPTGSHIAGLLARKGHRVRVLEEHDRPGDRVCCSGIVGADCYGQLPEGTRTLGSARSATFIAPSGRRVRLEKDCPQAYILDRASLDRSMAREAQSYGAEFVFGCTVENANRVNKHVEIQASLRGRRCVFEAKAVVLASGFSPALTDRLGLGKVGDYAVGAQTEIEVPDAEEVEIFFSSRIAHGFFAWVVPTYEKRALVGLVCRSKPGKNLQLFLQQLHCQGRVRTIEAPMQFGIIPLKPLPKTCGDRIIAVGDAAGQAKPTTGGGIYYGLICGDIGADVLDRALRKEDLSNRRLSEYEKGWKKALGSELRIGYISRVGFERLNDDSIEALFDIVQKHSLDKLVLNSRGFSFDWHGPILRWALSHPGISGVFGATLMGLWPPRFVKNMIWKTNRGQYYDAHGNPSPIGECATQ